MKCPKCAKEIREPKKHKVIDCNCGAKLMLIEISKRKELVNLEEASK